MKTVLVVVLLLSAGCANMTSGQRVALYCNPLAQGMNLAVLSLGLGMAFFGGVEQMDKAAKLFPIQHCINAVQDNTRPAQPSKAPPTTASASPVGPPSGPPQD